jgi:cytidine deaminase
MTVGPDDLLKLAATVRKRAYAGYSGYWVGAAIVDESGAVHLGCNVENTAFPQGSCAEANAIGAMVSAGGRRIVEIAVVGGSGEIGPCTPCGGCRQRIKEFADDGTRIITLDAQGRTVVYTIDQLLPAAIKPV